MTGLELKAMLRDARVTYAALAKHLSEPSERLRASIARNDVFSEERARALRWGLEELRHDDFMLDLDDRRRRFRVDFITRHGRRGGFDALSNTLSGLVRALGRKITDIDGGMLRVSTSDGQAFYRVLGATDLERVDEETWQVYPSRLEPVTMGLVRSALATRSDLEHTAALIERLSYHEPELARASVRMLADMIGRRESGYPKGAMWRAAQHADRVGEVLDARRAAAGFFGEDLDEDLVEASAREGRHGRSLDRIRVTWRGVHDVVTGRTHVCSMFNERGTHAPRIARVVDLIAQGHVLGVSERSPA